MQKVHYRLTCIAQQRLCSSSLISTLQHNSGHFRLRKRLRRCCVPLHWGTLGTNFAPVSAQPHNFRNVKETGPSQLSERLLELLLGTGKKKVIKKLKQWRFLETQVNRM